MSDPAATSDPIGTELAVIEATRRDAPADYWSEKPHGREMREREITLLQARIDGTPAPAVVKSAGADELALIDKTRRETPEKYWKDTSMQVRERQLISARDGLTEIEGEEAWRTAPADARRTLPPDLIAEWDRTGDFDGKLKRTQTAMALVTQGIGDETTAQDFWQSTSQFSAPAQTAMLREAGAGPPTNVRYADEHELESFKLLDGGKEFIATWGNEAPRRVAIVYERYNRLIRSMVPVDAKLFHQWFSQLITPQERAAVIWALAN